MNATPPLELLALSEFVGALVGQLDDVQDDLSAKARAGRNITWAIKDIHLELQVFIETDPHGTVRVRTAGPNETGSSTLKLDLGAITRDMILENAMHSASEEDNRPIDELLRKQHSGVSPTQLRRLRGLGIRTAGQFLSQQAHLRAISTRTGISLSTLQELRRTLSGPTLDHHEEQWRGDGVRVLRLLGANLSGNGPTRVRLCGEPVEVLSAQPSEVVVRPAQHHREGPIELVVDGEACESWLRPSSGAVAESDWRSDPWSDRGRSEAGRAGGGR